MSHSYLTCFVEAVKTVQYGSPLGKLFRAGRKKKMESGSVSGGIM